MKKIMNNFLKSKLPTSIHQNFDFNQLNILISNDKININTFDNYKLLNIHLSNNDSFMNQLKFLNYIFNNEQLFVDQTLLNLTNLNNESDNCLFYQSDIINILEQMNISLDQDYLIILDKNNKLVYFNNKNDYLDAIKTFKLLIRTNYLTD